jgi:hypothetical protein
LAEVRTNIGQISRAHLKSGKLRPLASSGLGVAVLGFPLKENARDHEFSFDYREI